jgi:predicted phage-related endonuclease
MTAVDVDRRSWLQERRQGVGASDVASIGQVPGAFGSPWSVWADKCALLPLDDEQVDQDDPRVFGRDLEHLIALRFERQCDGLVVANTQTVIHYPEFERWFATVDGLVCDGSTHPDDREPLGLFESKYTADAPWPELPEPYVWQVQWGMMCANAPHAWVAALHLPFGRPKFRVYEVARDDKLIAEIVAAVTAWWNAHVVTGTPPPPDDHPATARTIEQLFGHLTTEAYPRLPLDDYRSLVDELSSARKAKADAKRREDKAAALLRATWAAENPDLSEGFIDGELAVSWRSQGRSDIDRDAIHRDHGDKYDTHQTIRVMRLHGKRLA